MADTPNWHEVRCPNCNYWLASVENWHIGSRLKLKCKNCKQEWIFPSDKAEPTGKKKTLIQE